MDITQANTDDQELAKVLAGIDEENETVQQGAAQQPGVAPAPAQNAQSNTPPAIQKHQPAPAPASSTPAGTGIDEIKARAIDELRPLVGKLSIAPEEKFDTYLLLLRSTDDKSLIAPAHETALKIEDEARRAQALLDIIKEIDFLSQPAAK